MMLPFCFVVVGTTSCETCTKAHEPLNENEIVSIKACRYSATPSHVRQWVTLSRSQIATFVRSTADGTANDLKFAEGWQVGYELDVLLQDGKQLLIELDGRGRYWWHPPGEHDGEAFGGHLSPELNLPNLFRAENGASL